MYHTIAVGKELCLELVWDMFIVFFFIPIFKIKASSYKNETI